IGAGGCRSFRARRRPVDASYPLPVAVIGRSATPVSAEAAVVARGSLLNLVTMVGGAVLTFGLTVLVSRWLQPAGAGALFELIALFTIASNTCEFGADTGLVRWISRARAVGGLDQVR